MLLHLQGLGGRASRSRIIQVRLLVCTACLLLRRLRPADLVVCRELRENRQQAAVIHSLPPPADLTTALALALNWGGKKRSGLWVV